MMEISVENFLRVEKGDRTYRLFFRGERIFFDFNGVGRYTKREETKIRSFLGKLQRREEWEESKRSLEAHIRGFKEDLRASQRHHKSANIWSHQRVLDRKVAAEILNAGLENAWAKLRLLIERKPK